MASRSSSSGNVWRHDVFLSFRGQDTRNTFTAHLYNALCSKGINAFIDKNLVRGQEISPSIVQAIEGSRIALVVFSSDYASSTCCLEELVTILECMNSKGLIALPVFYNVDPSEVGEQRGRFGDALARHEAQFSGKLEIWREALAKASKLAGWHHSTGDEAELIRNIVENVLNKLNRTFLHVAEYPVKLHSHVEEMSHQLSIESSDVRMVGIYGIGGVGKTTISRAIYNKFANYFEGSCFLANVRETSKQHRGLVQLQETLLHEILGDKKISIGNFYRGINIIRSRLCSKRVLIVIDDVDGVDQLKNLAGQLNWFGRGSRIIITTRDKHLLTLHGVKTVHEVKELCPDDALLLFSWNAFRKPQPIEGFVNLSNSMVEYAKGLPLALVVLGSFLYGRSVHEWESELDKLKLNPKKEVYEILKISYDALDKNQKDIFLDIACFFKGMEQDSVIKILYACNFNPGIELKVLVEKSLLTIENNKLQMNDLIQSMGRKVVVEESSNCSRRSRLWSQEDILHVLRENTGTDEIQGIVLNMPEPEEIELNADAFVKMTSLRILIIHNAKFIGVPVHLPNALKWLEWPECPLPSMPSRFHARKLAALNMHHSCIRQFGEGFKNYLCLKFMDLRDSVFLTKTPDFATIPNLERLNLEGCTNLVEVHQSVGNLDKLEFLSLEFCSNLQSLPSSFKLRSLKTLLLTACKKVEVFPEIEERMTCLEKVCLNGTGIKVLPSSIANLTALKVLTLTYCRNLSHLPVNIYHLTNLKRLLLEGCSELCKFPLVAQDNIQSSSNVPSSNSGNSSGSGNGTFFLAPTVPDSSRTFSRYSLSGFPVLRCLDLHNCNLLEVNFLTGHNCFAMLKDLDLSGNSFIILPSICVLTNLRSLKLSKCKKLQEISGLPLNIKRLEARDCKSLIRFSQFEKVFTSKRGKRSSRLHDIDFSNCNRLAENQGKVWENALLSKVFRQGFRIEMFLPGSEIPEWFDYCSEEGSISFNLPSHRCEKIKALALCTIVNLKGRATANISREVFIDGLNVISFSRQFFSLESDHVWLYYLPCCFSRVLHSQQNESVRIEVSFKLLGAPMDSILKRCGVHVVYKQDDILGDPSGSCTLNCQIESTSLDLVRSCYDNDSELNLCQELKRKKTTEESLPARNHGEHQREPLMELDSGEHNREPWLSLSLQPMDQMNLDPQSIKTVED